VPGPCVDHVGDARDLARFEDGIFDEIYASHVLEHFDYKDALPQVLKEWHRVMALGGRLYVSVPDLDILCRLFIKPELAANDRFLVMRMMFGGHVDQYDYHLVGLNEGFLAFFLKEAGFVELKRTSSFGLFRDTSELTLGGVPISVNITGRKET
jgi:predicted SAM-dependent methyltransferase